MISNKYNKRCTYGPVDIEYRNGKPIGIHICDDNQDFVLGLNNLGYMEWQKAMDLVRKQGNSLPDKEQWTVINKHRNEVDELLEQSGGTPLSKSTYYWSSVEYSSNTAWYYIWQLWYPHYNYKYSTFTVRPALGHI